MRSTSVNHEWRNMPQLWRITDIFCPSVSIHVHKALVTRSAALTTCQTVTSFWDKTIKISPNPNAQHTARISHQVTHIRAQGFRDGAGQTIFEGSRRWIIAWIHCQLFSGETCSFQQRNRRWSTETTSKSERATDTCHPEICRLSVARVVILSQLFDEFKDTGQLGAFALSVLIHSLIHSLFFRINRPRTEFDRVWIYSYVESLLSCGTSMEWNELLPFPCCEPS